MQRSTLTQWTGLLSRTHSRFSVPPAPWLPPPPAFRGGGWRSSPRSRIQRLVRFACLGSRRTPRRPALDHVSRRSALRAAMLTQSYILMVVFFRPSVKTYPFKPVHRKTASTCSLSRSATVSQETSAVVSERDVARRDGSSIQRTVKSSAVGSGPVSGLVRSTIGPGPVWGLVCSVGAVWKVCGVTTIMWSVASSPFAGQRCVQAVCLVDLCLFTSLALLDV